MSNINNNIDEIKKSKLSNVEKIKLLNDMKIEIKKTKLTDEEKKARNRLNVSLHYYRHREQILENKKRQYQMKKDQIIQKNEDVLVDNDIVDEK